MANSGWDQATSIDDVLERRLRARLLRARGRLLLRILHGRQALGAVSSTRVTAVAKRAQ